MAQGPYSSHVPGGTGALNTPFHVFKDSLKCSNQDKRHLSMKSPFPSIRLGQAIGCLQHHCRRGSGQTQAALLLVSSLTGYQESQNQSLSQGLCLNWAERKGGLALPPWYPASECWGNPGSFLCQQNPCRTFQEPQQKGKARDREEHTFLGALHQGSQFSDSRR